MIHEEFWSLDWLNDFLSGNCLDLYSFFGVQTSVFIESRYHFILVSYHSVSFCPGMDFFCNWALSSRVTGETSGLSAPNVRII